MSWSHFSIGKKKKTGLERTVAAVVQQQIPLKIPYQRYNLSLFTFFCQRRTNDNKAIDSRGLSVWFYTWYSSILFKQLAVAGYCQMYAWRHRQGLEKWSHLWGFPRPETAICVGDMSLVLWVYLLAKYWFSCVASSNSMIFWEFQWCPTGVPSFTWGQLVLPLVRHVLWWHWKWAM